MEDESFLDDPLNGVDGWNRTLELSEFNNKVENTFLGNVNNVLEYGENRDTKVDIVHDPLLLTDDIKTELPELIECVDNNDLENICEIKEEPSEVDLTNNKAEKDGYLEDNDVILHKEIVYVNCMKPDEVVEVTSTDLHKLTTGIKYSHCETCNEVYTWFCLKCPMLSFILDKSTMDRLENRATKTIPNFLIIKNSPSAGHVCIYALKNIPQFVKFGPFEGLDPIQTTSGCAWKLKNGKLYMSPDSAKRSNWMQYVNCAKLISEQNLTIFQYGGNLFFRTSREINAGDELLVYYGEVNSAGSGDAQSYCYPVVDNQMENIYACTFCCLGFSAEVYLHKHNSICPNRDNKVLYKEIVQCAFCKIYLDSGENSNHHMKFCCVKYTWKRPILETSQEVEKSQCKIDNNKHSTIATKFKCIECTYEAEQLVDLKTHVYTFHTPYECTVCKNQFDNANELKDHLQNVHDNKTREEPIECIVCKKQFVSKKNLLYHLKTQHRPVTIGYKAKQSFPCKICSKLITTKALLKKHVSNVHVMATDKKYKCPLCRYQTNYKCSYYRHRLKSHDTEVEQEKPLKCEICGYRTSKKGHYKTHLLVHQERKVFRCNTCGKNYFQEANLNQHIKCNHDPYNNGEREFKCDECSYQTNSKSALGKHIKNVHVFGKKEDRRFKCSQCSFATNYKRSMDVHLLKHDGMEKLEAII